jgi:NACHT domain- and WD repeat-containing protein
MRTFRVFLSSTFNDLELEREAFRERVVPSLRRLCRGNGADFQAVDLRWGISGKADLDQRTMQICLTEVRRCLSVTPRPNFVVLLGDRYGWRPVPAELPAPLFERLLVHASSTGIALLQRWYMRDDNGVPPTYYLVRREHDYRDSDRWRAVERDLLRALEDAAHSLDLPDSERVLLGASATEQEIQYGAFSSDPTDRVFCFFRNIRGQFPDPAVQHYFDTEGSSQDLQARAALQRLKTRLRSAFGNRVREYDAEWRDGRLSAEHIDLFCRDVQASLENVITRELSDPAYLDELHRERDEHASFARGRTRVFVGRKDLLDAIERHTVSSSRSAFAMIGPSGAGKSALMARAATEAIQRYSDAVVVCRFAGVTPQSSDTASLLRSVCLDVATAYSRDTSTVRDTYEQLVRDFRLRLEYAHAGKPLVVFIDALDQLADIAVRSLLSWIPVELPPYVRLFVSALPVLRDSVARVVAEDNIATVRPLQPMECNDIVDEGLHVARRALQGPQRSAVEERTHASPSPLYIRLLLERVSHWRSASGVPALGPDVPSLLSQLFEDLSRPENHGEQLVSRTLGMLAAARHGLSEDELLDNLSADPDVVEEFRKRSVRASESTVLPPIVWSRLQANLEPYLTTRGADGASLLAFFHRQFRERVEELYFGPARIHLHRHLAAYFASQPLYLDKERRIPNLRKLSEVSFQQVNGKLSEEARRLLLDVVFLETKVRVAGPQAVVDDFDRLITAGCCTDPAVLEQLRDAIRSRSHVLRGDPGQFHSQLIGRLCGATEPELAGLLAEVRHQASGVWLRPVTRSLGMAGDALIRILGGHQAVIWQVSVSRTGRYATSAGNDNACVLWDLEAFVELHRLPHEEPVFAAVISPDERHVVCAAGSTLLLWDLSRGVQLWAERTDYGSIRALALSHDGRFAVFGSDQGVIGTWDLTTCTVTPRIRGFPVGCLAILPDNDTVVAGRRQVVGISDSEGPTLGVWKLSTAQLIRTFGAGRDVNSMTLAPNGSGVVVALADGSVQLWNIEEASLERSFRYAHWWADGATITPDGRYIIAGGVDYCVRVWDTASQELYATLKDHHNIVRTTAVLPDGHRLLSGSDDQTVRLWDLRRARKVGPETAHAGKVHALCQSPDGRWVVSASADKSISFWDPHTGSRIDTLTGHSAEAWSSAFTPDGGTLLTLQNGSQTIVWDVGSRRQRQVLRLVPRATAFANRVVPCADNRHFFCGGEMFEIETGKVAYQLPEYETGVVQVLPDGEHIIFHGNGTPLRVWSLKTHSEVTTLGGYGSRTSMLNDTRLLISGYELAVWDVRTWTRIRTIATGHRGAVNDVASRGDLGLAATASGDHDAKLWNTETGEHLATFTAESPLFCCLISSSVPMVILGDDLGNLHFLQVEGLGTAATSTIS